MGGAYRNEAGDILGVFWGKIGVNTNNAAKLKDLLGGLRMVTTHGWLPFIIEGDSQVILQMATKLLHGKEVHMVVDNWRLAHNLEQLRELLITHSEVRI